VDEQDFHTSTWFALWSLKATPRDVIAKLNNAAVAALADPGGRKRVVDLGQEIFAREQPPPEALAPFHVVADHQGGRSQGRVKLILGVKVCRWH
jgi:Tripartite tricarboxylate transporter family receptor